MNLTDRAGFCKLSLFAGARSEHQEQIVNVAAIARLALGHCLIDLCQGVVPALLPFLVQERGFSNAAAASLVFALSVTSSVVQPLFGRMADRVHAPWLLPTSILLAGFALAVGAQASRYGLVIAAFGMSGLGVAAFHPEAARAAHLASGDRRTTGMSLFSLGGGVGFALAPILTKNIEDLFGTTGLLLLLGPTAVIAWLATQVRANLPAHHAQGHSHQHAGGDDWHAFAILSGATISRSIVFYGLNTFLGLYFMKQFSQTPSQGSQALAVFLGTSIIGTLMGGWLADRHGRRGVIQIGFLGSAVFLALFAMAKSPEVALWLLVPLALCFFMPTSVLVVLGQEYLPNRLGVASGVTLGLAVSVGGMTAPALGRLADVYGFGVVFAVLWGMVIFASVQTFILPPVGRKSHEASLDLDAPDRVASGMEQG